jgi:hypothetical protein
MSALVQILINGLIALVLPVLVRIVAARWSGAVRAVTLLLLTAVTGFLTQTLANPHLNWVLVALYWGEGWIVAVGTYFGLWKPVAVHLAAQRAALHR